MCRDTASVECMEERGLTPPPGQGAGVPPAVCASLAGAGRGVDTAVWWLLCLVWSGPADNITFINWWNIGSFGPSLDSGQWT